MEEIKKKKQERINISKTVGQLNIWHSINYMQAIMADSEWIRRAAIQR